MKKIEVSFKTSDVKLYLNVKDWEVVNERIKVIDRDGDEVLYPWTVSEVRERCAVE